MFRVVKSPSTELARTNFIFMNPRDMDSNVKYVLIDGLHAFSIRTSNEVNQGDIATTLFHRRLASLSLAQTVNIQPFDPSSETKRYYIGTMNLTIDFLQRSVNTDEVFEVEQITALFIKLFGYQIFTEGQQVNFDFHGIEMLVQVSACDLVDSNAIRAGNKVSQSESTRGIKRGILINQTDIFISKGPDSTIKIKGDPKKMQSNAIIQPNFKFEDLGIGGLDKEFSQIFRRAFASRIFPPAMVEKLGIQHVKGILLYGPPGTGKTLMARQIGKMLNAREPKIVNGPEILNKFVGQSEENVRKLFADAEAEYKQKGEESGLHIIIFDELDAICKQRGSKNDGTGVGDSIVNQLLSKMDGVDQLNNILIIGMTNRLDMIDEALLRPGRLEIHMEINLPDENGRLQIINVHTAKMKENDLLGEDVIVEELAKLTKNYSGAEIAGLCKSASSFSFNRHMKIGQTVKVDTNFDNMKIMRSDFIEALNEIHPAFGISETELKNCALNGIIQFGSHISRILEDGDLFIKQVKNSDKTPVTSCLLYGAPGSGKTALAASIAINSKFPFIKLISPDNMTGFTEQAKINHIIKIFNDAHRSELSVVIIDSIEQILDWVAIGPRFSNAVLQTLFVFLKKVPPKNHKLLIIGTTSQRDVLRQMDMLDAFDSSIGVPNITDVSILYRVLGALNTFQDKDLDRIGRSLDKSKKISIPIKRLIMVSQMAAQSENDVPSKFITALEDYYL